MIKDRIVEILAFEKITAPMLQELTGIKRYTWQNIRNKPGRVIKEVEIEAISTLFKEYRYWIISGEELPEVGQISPATKAAQKAQ